MAKLIFAGLEEGKLYVEKKDLYREFKYKVEEGVFMVIYPNGGEEPVDFRDWHIQSILETEFEEVKPKLTDTQRKVLEGRLLEGFEWIAKDKCDEYYFYTHRPSKDNDGYWKNTNTCCESLLKFDFLSWEDEEPTNIREFLEEE